jgi:hypothetical protein
MTGLTVLVVDPDARSRTQTVNALCALGLYALGVYVPSDAVALLDGILPDAILVRTDEPDLAIEHLRQHTMLVHVDASAPVEEALSALLQRLARQPEAPALN